MKTMILGLALILGASMSFAQEADGERENFREAFDTCLEENGLSRPEPGQRPSEEERTLMDTCLASKGISRPEHDRQRGKFRRDQADGQNGAFGHKKRRTAGAAAR